jgi:hypothetical protein
MSWITSVVESISSFFNRSSETQLFKAKVRESNKIDRIFWKKRFQQVFAECDLDELELIRNLVDSNNTPQKTKLDVCNNDYREVKVNGVKEQMYQLLKTTSSENEYGFIGSVTNTVRITVPVFKQLKKEFNKYGRCRLPVNKQKTRTKK